MRTAVQVGYMVSDVRSLAPGTKQRALLLTGIRELLSQYANIEVLFMGNSGELTEYDTFNAPPSQPFDYLNADGSISRPQGGSSLYRKVIKGKDFNPETMSLRKIL